ncbi:hypothetical protein [Bradyrhizobium sp. NBAIM01]|nr:hypothetical protein [Bradyrhizobium sp. NBAIM01]MCA1510507.1 hypothetical protein [Bradyrhizobium sp. NBAIM01]
MDDLALPLRHPTARMYCALTVAPFGGMLEEPWAEAVFIRRDLTPPQRAN